MDQVYRNACLTICASGASRVSEGIFRERVPMTVRWGSLVSDGTKSKSDIFLRWHADRFYDGKDISNILGDQPLSNRGWAVQERLLSPRKVFLTSQQMIGQCSCLQCFEDGRVVVANDSQRFSHSLLADEKLSYAKWDGVILDFTECNLTRSSDRLPALSGIAKLFAEKLGDDYVAGHWLKALPYFLLWRPFSEPQDFRPDGIAYHAPSWSWASVEVAVRTLPDYTPRRRLIEILDFHVKSRSSANPYGQVVDGWIDLQALTLPVQISRDEENKYRAIFKLSGSDLQLCCDWDAGIWLDRNEASINALVVFFHEDERFRDFSGLGYDGLLVVASELRQGTFVRVGEFQHSVILPAILDAMPETWVCKELDEVGEVKLQRIRIV